MSDRSRFIVPILLHEEDSFSYIATGFIVKHNSNHYLLTAGHTFDVDEEYESIEESNLNKRQHFIVSDFLIEKLDEFENLAPRSSKKSSFFCKQLIYLDEI
jgi:hypothetical protein